MVTSPNGGGGRCRPKRLNVGCWNMRTLVESDGSIATGVSRQGGRGVTVDRKAMLLVSATKPFHCDTCLRSFRCPQDIA